MSDSSVNEQANKWGAFETLLSEVSGALADIVSNLENNTKQDVLVEISNSLIDLVANLEAVPKTDFATAAEVIAEAIKTIKLEASKIEVNPIINVSPTPIENIINIPEITPVIHIMQDMSKNTQWNFKMQYDSKGLITDITAIKAAP